MSDASPHRLRLGHLLGIGAAALLLASGLAWWLLNSSPASPEPSNASPAAAGPRRTGFVQAPAPSPGPGESGGPARRVQGVLSDLAGEPVPDTDVLVYASAQSPGPLYLCADLQDAVPVFDAACPEASQAFFDALDASALEPTPLAVVRTGAGGEFAFEAPAGRFDLWAQRGSSYAVLVDLDPSAESAALDLRFVEGSEVRGLVTSSPDSQPVPGAEVVAVQLRPLKAFRTRSGADGAFSFGPLPVEPMVGLAARSGDYLPVHFNASSGEDVPVELSPPGALSGLALSNGAPAAGARIVLDGSRETVADAQGRFAFARVACDLCGVSAELGDRWAREDVSLDEARQGFVELRLLPVGRLEIHLVSRRTGAPLEGEVVCDVPGPDLPAPGTFVFAHAPRGRTELFATAEGHVALKQTVLVGAGTTAVTLALDEELPVTGKVLGADGAPLGDTLVFVLSGPQGGEQNCTTDEAGAFALHGLGPGRHTLGVTHPLHLREEVAVDLPSAGPVIIQLRRAGRILAQVVDPAGSPVPEATVLASQAQPARVRSAATDEAGQASVSPLPPGSWSVTAAASGWASSEATVVEVTAGDVPVRLALKPGLTLAGRVVDDAGTAVPGAEVVALPESPASSLLMAQATCDEAGQFVLRGLQDATYQLLPRLDTAEGAAKAARPGAEAVVLVLERAGEILGRVVRGGVPVSTLFFVEGAPFEHGDGRFNVSLPAGEHELRLTGSFAPRTLSVTLRPGQTLDLGEVAVAGGGVIEGTAASTSGPVGGLEIVVSSAEDPAEEDRATTDLDGRFRFTDLSAGPHLLAGAGGEGIVRATTVSVLAGQTVQARLQVEPAGRIVGAVTDSSGNPVRFAHVVVTSGRESAQMVLCDRQGAFSVEGLAPGSYQILVTERRTKLTAATTAEVRAAAETRVELRLPGNTFALDPFEDEP